VIKLSEVRRDVRLLRTQPENPIVYDRNFRSKSGIPIGNRLSDFQSEISDQLSDQILFPIGFPVGFFITFRWDPIVFNQNFRSEILCEFWAGKVARSIVMIDEVTSWQPKVFGLIYSLRDIERAFSINIRNVKVWEKPKLLNSRFLGDWYFLKCDNAN